MARVTDEELTQLFADALHRSGPNGNPEKIDLGFARIRAGVLVRTLSEAGLIVIREERKGRREKGPSLTMVKTPADLDATE
jgi:hypothetical protein